jgi:hypothetical protein
MLATAAELRGNEGRSVRSASLVLFILLTGITVLQPVRETLGLTRGIENVRRLFLDTFGVRAGDASGAFLDRGLAVLGPAPLLLRPGGVRPRNAVAGGLRLPRPHPNRDGKAAVII